MWPQNVPLAYDRILDQRNIYAKIELVDSAVSKEKKLEVQNGAPKARAARGVWGHAPQNILQSRGALQELFVPVRFILRTLLFVFRPRREPLRRLCELLSTLSRSNADLKSITLATSITN